MAKKGIGELKVEDSGFVIAVNREKNKEFIDNKRERFTIAHEIAHTFFYNIAETPPQRRLSPQSDNSDEKLCNRLAAAILLPKEKIDNFVKNYFGILQHGFSKGF